jgi:hypothetical protein
MPNTYTLIASSTVGSGGAASIDFTSIPSTYTDLQLVVSARSNRAATNDGITIAFNGSTANFTSRYLLGDGSTASSGTSTNYAGVLNGGSSTASTFGNTSIYIPNYAGSTNKSVSTDSIFENNGTIGYDQLTALLWSITSAITSISLTSSTSSTLVQYSTAYLYGIKNS